MIAFPQTPDYTGLNLPLRIEMRLQNLPVEGTLPAEIEGAFFRAVPDRAHAPMMDDDTILSDDGMISRFTFAKGYVDYEIRYVETARYLAEQRARRALFGRYRNPFTDDPSVAGVDRTVANTTPLWHAGRLFMTKEDGRAYEVDPETLATIGSWDYHGALRSETMTAHARIDPDTGEMFFFGYEAGGLCTRDISYCIADADGALVSEQWFEAPYCAMMHDFAVTERHAIFPVFPTTSDLDRLKGGGVHWTHDPALDSWVGIMPRYGRVEDMRWFKGPPGVSALHIMNAFEDGEGRINLDLHMTDSIMFPFIRAPSGLVPSPAGVGGGLTRWTFDLSSNDGAFTSQVIGPPGDMPRTRDSDQGRAYRDAWYLSMNPAGGPPLPGGPVGVAMTALLRIGFDDGRIDMLALPPGHGINEPVHVPADDPAQAGWLIAVVDREAGGNFHSELWVIDADDLAAPPVARVTMPIRLRPQVHGTWVPQAKLDRAVKAGLDSSNASPGVGEHATGQEAT